ncbi:hypothetical protein CPB97_000374 [Podila verticillata]|nr:hypothetical protein CPB97_000374 [Podila verticillata]
MTVPRWNRVVLLSLLVTLFSSSIVHINPESGTLVTAQKLPFFRQKQLPIDPEAARREQQAVDALHVLSSSSPPTYQQESLDSENKQKRLSKGKGMDLLAVEASHASSSEASGEAKEQHDITNPDIKSPKDNKKPRKASGHASDIIHEHDHADNDAYDDIVWYDGPHRDDEDEHGYDDHNGHHDHDDDENEEEGEEKQAPGKKTSPEVLANLQQLSGTPKSDLEKQLVGQAQRQLAFQQHGHTEDDTSHESAQVFQHSGADVIASGISPKEFCLRLKHECESTCREFTAEVEHLPTSCAAGSVAELLFWGRCCQIGQEHRQAFSSEGGANKGKKKKTMIHLSKSKNLEFNEGEESVEARQERLIEEHLRSQLKRHQAQQEMNQQKPQ